MNRESIYWSLLPANGGGDSVVSRVLLPPAKIDIKSTNPGWDIHSHIFKFNLNQHLATLTLLFHTVEKSFSKEMTMNSLKKVT